MEVKRTVGFLNVGAFNMHPVIPFEMFMSSVYSKILVSL